MLFALTGLMLMEAKYSSLLVMLGGLSMGVGLALKSSLENCLAALTILAGQLVRNGDYIEVDGIYGCVRKIGFRSTVMETEEGAVLTIPNTQLVDSKFLNWTRSNPLRRVELLVDVAYNSDLAKVTELLRKVVANTEGVQSFPVPGNPVPGAGGEFDPVRGVLLGGRAALVADAGPASLPGTGNFPRKRP